jgi:hypothetical protein
MRSTTLNASGKTQVNNHESPASGPGMWRGGESLLRSGEVMEGARDSKQGKRSASVRSTRTETPHPRGGKVLRTTTG